MLEFGIGVFIEEMDPEASNASVSEEQSCSFHVSVDKENGKEILFEKSVTLNPDQNKSYFLMRSVDLSQFTGDVRLSFSTKGENNISAFWYNPVIYRTDRTRPNVILVSIDTLRADHLGCYGYARDTSPNIDALARDSALFRYAYSTA
ncbi:MAG: sulfatase-like hydrolase/transferase, partial [Candidatus Aminicenantes bacterium]|nr:sulfatase-like hydrolase/transferase [Candidatus Aminicenantes bacterium]